MAEIAPRLTPERLAEIRNSHKSCKWPCDINLVFAALDAVTRERDEARKDSARLDWLGKRLSDP